MDIWKDNIIYVIEEGYSAWSAKFGSMMYKDVVIKVVFLWQLSQ